MTGVVLSTEFIPLLEALGIDTARSKKVVLTWEPFSVVHVDVTYMGTAENAKYALEAITRRYKIVLDEEHSES